MLKKTMLIGMMCISFLGISQIQCDGTTKDSIQCKNITKSESGLCHVHNPDHKTGKCVGPTVICSGTTKKNKPCKNKTKDLSGRCHNHRD